MAPASWKSGGRDGVLLTLDGFILALNMAKDACGLPPVQAAFGSASTLLITIRVLQHIPFCNNELLTHVYLGHRNQPAGLH